MSAPKRLPCAALLAFTLLFASACSKSDELRAKQKAREAGQELKQDLKQAGKEVKEGLQKAKKEVREATGEADRKKP